MSELNKTNALLAECEAFLADLSADEQSTLSGGYGCCYKRGDDDDDDKGGGKCCYGYGV